MNNLIPTIQRSKKSAKPRYIKPDSVKQLEADTFLSGYNAGYNRVFSGIVAMVRVTGYTPPYI